MAAVRSRILCVTDFVLEELFQAVILEHGDVYKLLIETHTIPLFLIHEVYYRTLTNNHNAFVDLLG